jgi:hypothetical protein
MKLRLYNNSVRFRLTQSEVKRLAGGERLAETLALPSDFQNNSQQQACFVYAMESTSPEAPANAITLAPSRGNEIRVLVPQATLERWAASDEVGLYAEQRIQGHVQGSSNQQASIRIIIEKDFRCIDGEPDEFEADRYPHPHEAC